MSELFIDHYDAEGNPVWKACVEPEDGSSMTGSSFND
jgi:hypothetical protein